MPYVPIAQHFYSQPDEVELVKVKLFKQVAYYCLCLHLLFIFAFWYSHVYILAIANIASVAAWASGIHLLNRGHSHLALRVFCIEVTVHSVLVCATLGMDYGFQYYLWTIACMLLLDLQLKLRLAITLSLSLIVLFAVLFELYGTVNTTFVFHDYARPIHFINVFICGLPMIYVIGQIRESTFIQRRQLATLAARDPLTNLFNRRYAKELILRAHASCAHNDQSLCVVMADLDHFKQINDQLGHDMGDEVLQTVSDILHKHVTDQDIAVRWGGEEFLLVLVDCNLEQAVHRLETLRQTLEMQQFNGNELTATMSFGVALWHTALPFSVALQLADDALYTSKAQGRNRVTAAQAS
ncbi:DNA polymerase III subunit delta' [Pseudoalteromonas rubra]|uniref:diguanylate cyclase n=1 Tax=Pseudoalteromonas rubra TaxID=43658 RepID=A0A5S3WNI1_9GAMM|nr:DNA polymerase III subunit delta' [Pseudoalteromonas rubra]TMP28785.1 DNA polymerase III subunit delta' [Pseudoalteromonas rubra]